MTILNHTLGFPRVGLRRELKKAQESYWAGNSTREELLAVGRGPVLVTDQQKQAGSTCAGGRFFGTIMLTTVCCWVTFPASSEQRWFGRYDTLFIGRGRAPTGEPWQRK